MRRYAARLLFGPLVVVLVACLAGAIAHAVSQSDTAYYDGFQDLEGLDAARSQDIVLDALGGVRLRTKGAATPTTWTSQGHFTAVSPAVGALTGLPTLDAAATLGSLKLLSSPLAFRRAQTGPVLSPPTPLDTGGLPVVDGFGVGGMCVQRVDDVYYMWYTGVPENEYAQSIYLATSTDGLNWVKEATPVLERGAAGAFDSRQLGKPTVIYDATNLEAPFRMWYAGEGDLGGSIGYATSLDGREWTKYVPEGATEPAPVYTPGKIGMADSYRVTHPCVLFANGVYFMWYTADDSNNKRVAYATSTDGLTWDRGGVVFDVGTGNYSEGAFAPAVVRLGLETPDDPSDDGFHMIFTGNKVVAGSDIQSKLINASSDDGITWAAGNIAFSAAGGDTAFDGYNVSQPAILYDPLDVAHPYKMWYVGNNPDENGNFHDRIGLAYQKSTSSVSQWEKVPGVLGVPYYESWVTLGEQGTAFDSMMVADLRGVWVSAPVNAAYGFYTGTNAADFKKRIGVMQSADSGLTWTDVNAHATLIDAGPAGTFDEGGIACPAPVEKTTPGTGWWVLHTSFAADGSPSIGLHEVSQDLATVTRTASAAVVVPSGGLFDAAGQADPYAVRDGLQMVVFYAGADAGGTWSLGVAASATGDPMTISAGHQVLAPTPGSYDAGGLRKPVAHSMPDGSWRLFYAAIGDDGVSRIAYATSPDGTTWTKQGLVMTESTAAYDFAEGGVEPCSAGSIGSGESLFFTGTDRFGWTRIGKAQASGAGFLDGGWAEYELLNPTSRDWRKISWLPKAQPAGTDAQVWVSYYPTYSGDWSNAFPVTNDSDLPFLLSVQDMRWQVRMSVTDPLIDATVSPQLDELTVDHAPVQFPASGKAVTLPIGPPDGLYLLTWGDLTIDADIPGGTGVTVTVEDDAGARIVAAQPLTGGITTIPLAGIAPLGAKLVAVLELTSNDPTCDLTPKLKSLGASYTSTTTPAQMTLTAAKTLLTYGGSTTLSGKLFSDPTPLDALDGNATPLPGQTVTIKAHAADATGYADVGTATTAADGTFTMAVKPLAVTSYRAEWAGGTIESVVYPPASAGVRIDVKAKVTVAVAKYNRRMGKYYLYKLGRAVYVKGAVTPNHYRLDDGTTAGKVTVVVYKYKSTGWAKVKSSTRTLTSTSRYTWSWKPSARGKYRIATTFKGDSTHLAATTTFKYVKVY